MNENDSKKERERKPRTHPHNFFFAISIFSALILCLFVLTNNHKELTVIQQENAALEQKQRETEEKFGRALVEIRLILDENGKIKRKNITLGRRLDAYISVLKERTGIEIEWEK